MNKRVLVLCTTDSMIWNFLVPHIKEMQRLGFQVECACSRTGSFFDDLVSIHKLAMHEIKFDRSPYNPINIIAFKELKNLVQSKKYDTIFCHEPVGGLMGRLVGRVCKTKVVYMAHGFHFYKNAPLKNKLIYYTVEKCLSYLTDVLITINQEDYEAALKFNAKEVILMPGIGVDTGAFYKRDYWKVIRKDFQLNDQDTIILSVGELIDRKNHEVIIRALYEMKDIHVHYFIAGNGTLYNYLSSLIDELHLNNNVHLLGYRKDIGYLCNGADIFVLPSFQEGLSVALMEAMACGKPVIASRIRGNVDLIQEGLGGYLIEPEDVMGFAESLRILKDNSELREQFGSYNQVRVKEFDIKEVQDLMKDMYVKYF